jgi:hypothetical protein
METLTMLFIHTPWRQAHKWEVNQEGLIDYDGSMLSPLEVYQRFSVDYPNFKVLRAEVCQRIPAPENSERPYRWVDLERFDK